MRPKYYRVKVWDSILKEVQADIAWANNTAKNNSQWFTMASTESLRMIGELLSKNSSELTKNRYDYLKIRASFCATDKKKWNSLLKGEK